MTALLTCALAAGTSALAANVVFKEDFEGDLSKWTCNDEEITTQAVITDVVAHSGSSCLNLFGYSRDGIAIYAPELDLPTGYVEAWYLDTTGDRYSFVDQAYLLVEGDTNTKATCQIGQNGNPINSTDQTHYGVFFDGDFGFKPADAARSKGWHKFGFELLEGGEGRIYIDDKLQAEYQHDDWTLINKVGLLSYYSALRDGAIGVPVHESYWDDIVVYDKKP